MKYLFAVLLLIQGSISIAQSPTLIHDESYKDYSFWKFKAQLEEAIIEKDIQLLAPLVADRLMMSDNLCPYEGCLKSFFLKDLEDTGSYYWQILEKITRFGFTYTESQDTKTPVAHDKQVFKGPSYINNINTDTETIILGSNVNIRERASLKSKVIRQATFEKFKCDCNITDQTETTYQDADGLLWLEIKLGNGKVGYVAAKFTSSDFSTELVIGKVNGNWKIISIYTPSGC